MEGQNGVTPSIIDELYSSDIQGEQIEAKGGVIRSIIHELRSLDIQLDQMEDESGATRSIIDEFLLRRSTEIKWKVKVVLLEV